MRSTLPPLLLKTLKSISVRLFAIPTADPIVYLHSHSTSLSPSADAIRAAAVWASPESALLPNMPASLLRLLPVPPLATSVLSVIAEFLSKPQMVSSLVS